MFTTILKTHQKIDKVAYLSLKNAGMEGSLPSLKQILHFEGHNGPDGIKSKSPSIDEPWHFYDPHNPGDMSLVTDIRHHYDSLVASLRASNAERAAFEASWLAHAIVDGMTPAHQHTYEVELIDIKGEGNEGRKSVVSKLFIPAKTVRGLLRANWRYIGMKGLLSTHFLFEAGVGVLTLIRRFQLVPAEKIDVASAQTIGIEEVFMQAARKVSTYDMYEHFYKRGWTFSLAKQVHQALLPLMIETVSLVWALAVVDAQEEQIS